VYSYCVYYCMKGTKDCGLAVDRLIDKILKLIHVKLNINTFISFRGIGFQKNNLVYFIGIILQNYIDFSPLYPKCFNILVR